jgi:hypothetical protein
MLQFCLNLHVRVILSIFCRVDLLVFNLSSVPRIVSIKFNPLRHLGMSSIKSDLLMDRSGMNSLVGKLCLRFYQNL